MRCPLNFFLLLLMLFCTTVLFGQTKLLDSLLHSAETANGDSERLQKKIDYAIGLSKFNFGKSLTIMNEVQEQSALKKLNTIYANALNAKGTIEYDRGDYINSIINYQQAANEYDRLSKSQWFAATLGNMGASYSLLNMLDTAQKYYMLCIDELEKLKDSTSLMTAYFNVAYIFIDMEEWHKTYRYLLKSSTYISATQQNIESQPLCTSGRLANVCFKLNKLDEGKKLLQVCDSLFNISETSLGKVYYFNAYGTYYFSINNFVEAIDQHKKSYQYTLYWKDPYFITDEAWEIGRTYLKMNQTDSAKKYLQIAIDTAKAYNYLPKIRFILNEWCTYYANMGNYEEAYAYRTELLHFSDSMITVQNHNRILLYDAKYQSEKRENQIEQLEKDKKIQLLLIKQKNTLNYFLTGTAVTLLLLGLLLYGNYRQKQIIHTKKINELEQEKQFIATNAILQSQEEERSRMAKDLHDGVGGMLSGIKLNLSSMKGNMIIQEKDALLFNKSIIQLDNAIAEMRRVAHNMMPEALIKFGLKEAIQDYCDGINESLAVTMKFTAIGESSPLEKSIEVILYRIVQELTNNAIKHASAKNIFIQFSQHPKGLSLVVEDDGVGFDTKQMTKGTGLQNVQSRVDYLKGYFSIESETGKGTSVNVELPL